MKNVLEVDQSGLCLECGTCEGVCPHKNVKLIPDESGRNRVHILDDSHCAKCPGICLKACPGHEIDMDQLNLQVFGKLPENYWAGNYKQAFLGYSPDEVIQKTSASGGIVSTLLIHALETGMIQGVYLLTPQSGKPFELTAALATDAEAVLAAAGSVYWPAPIGQCLREILHSDGKYAFIGLPCEIQALRKAQKVYQQLNDKIAFAIGIYCGGRTTIAGQRFAFSRYGIELDELAEIKYRQPEWPGHLKVTLKDGGEVHVYKPQQLQGFSGQIFGAPRCIYCNDAIADLSDISTGDAIRLEGFRNPEEKSILVARTKVGLELLEAARRANKLVLREVPIDKLVHSQHRPILHKKLALWARLKVAKKLFGKAVPKITMTAPDGAIKLKPVFFTAGARIILMGDLTSKPLFRKLLKIVPMRWLKKYSNFEIYS